MFPLFEKGKNKSNEDIKPNPMNTSMAWAIESSLLDIYFLLVHRIEGLGLSLTDFWSMDTWTTSRLYCLELDLIDKEEKELNKDKPESQNSDEVKDVYEEMFPNES